MYGSPNWHFWLIGFGLTLCIEAPLVLWLLAGAEPSLRRRVALLLLANFVTHPLVWFFFPGLPLPRLVSLLLSEGWALGAEIFIYASYARRCGMLRAALTSTAANAASWGIGMAIVGRWGGWLFG